MSPIDFSAVPSKIGKKSSKIADSGLNAENFMFLKVLDIGKGLSGEAYDFTLRLNPGVQSSAEKPL